MATAYSGAAIDLQVTRDGRICDAVNGQYVTITRTGRKYGISSVTGKLDSVGDNRLFPEKYANGGFWTAIEESRQNYLLNSGMNVGSGGLATSWTRSSSMTPNSPVQSLDADCIEGAYSQRFQVTQGNVTSITSFMYQSTVPASFAAGDLVAGSIWVKDDSAAGAVGIRMVLKVFNASSGVVTQVFSATATRGAGWVKLTATLTAGAATDFAQISVLPVNTPVTGDVFDVRIDAAQLEKGAFATSYIPTTTTAVTRPADVVTFPSTSLVAANGTFAAVVGGSTTLGNSRRVLSLSPVTGNVRRMELLITATGTGGGCVGGDDGANVYPYGGVNPTSASWTVAMKWSGTVASATTNGAVWTDLATDATTTLPSDPLYCGSAHAYGNFLNAPVHRLVAFTTALSNAEILDLSNRMLAGIPKRHYYSTFGG